MAERLLLCKQCNKKFPKSELIKYKSKNMCPVCYEQEKKLDAEKTELCSTIKQIYNLDYVPPGLLKQIKQFKQEYNFSYTGMKLTLLYCKNVLHLEFSPSRGLGIIPYKYEEAKKEYIRRKQMAEKTRNINNGRTLNSVKTIVTKINTENTYLKKKIINLEEII